MSEKLTFEETQLANLLRNEILKVSEPAVPTPSKRSISDFEFVSSNKTPLLSPIFSMSLDEILAFVEEFDVGELATLSVAELNHIGKVLGVDPKTFTQGA